MRLFPIAVATCLLASGCDRSAAPADQQSSKPTRTPGDAAIEREVANIRMGVERSVETRRLDDLERRIAQLESSPDKLDLELLTNRVQALEAKAGVADLAAPVAAPGAAPSSTASTPARARKPAPRPSPTTAKDPER